VLTADDGKVVLTGDPRVSDGPNVLEGASITLYLDDERLECASCRLVVQGAAVAPVRP
jgi:lipopolysaccharide export system protein LptA